MIALQSDVRVYLACGYTDMRKGMQGLAMLVQQVLAEDPFNGALYAFRGRRGNLLKLVWHDGIGLCMLTKRLERGHFIWPMTSHGLDRAVGRAIVDAARRLRVAGDGAQPEARAGRLIRVGVITLESLAATRRRASSSSRCADRSRGPA